MKKPEEYKSLAPSLKGVLPPDIVEKVYGETSNPEHWEIAFAIAEGVYVGFRQDKKRTLDAESFMEHLEKVSKSMLDKVADL